MPAEEMTIQEEPGADCIGFMLYQNSNVFYGVCYHLSEKAKTPAAEVLKKLILDEENSEEK